MCEHSGNVWIAYGGSLLKCSPWQLRPATTEEEAGENNVSAEIKSEAGLLKNKELITAIKFVVIVMHFTIEYHFEQSTSRGCSYG